VFRLWGQSVTGVLLASIAGLVLWPVVGAKAALLVYVILLLLLLYHHLYHLTALHRWLKDPRLDTLPEGRFEWEEIFAALARLLRRGARASGFATERWTLPRPRAGSWSATGGAAPA